MITDVVGQKYRQGTAKMSCLGTVMSGISIWKTGRLGLPQCLGLESIGGIFTHMSVAWASAQRDVLRLVRLLTWWLKVPKVCV